ncbi:MAG: bifunctional heptose 7-phosphate kinase/heptose 1-phosphate adenyltransferase [Nanoarchaeota archaeon]
MSKRPAELIQLFPKATVLVIGEIMLDKTIIGDVSRIAPEAPVPVVHVSEEQHFLGGAANVAANIASLGGRAILCGYVGADVAADKVRSLCKEKGITCAFSVAKEPTILKMRVTSAGQQLVRVDYEQKWTGTDRYDLLDAARSHLSDIDVIVLSDYNKGLHTPELVKSALALGKPVIVDPKPENLAMFAGATLIQPNHLAAEKATGKKLDTEEAVTCAGQELSKKLGSNLLITRGAHGMSLIERDGSVMHIPTQAREVYDVTGAGDSSIATLSLAVGAGASLREAVILANQTAGIKVGKRGTATVSARELANAFESGHIKIKTADEIQWISEELKGRDKKIVFTNGFFDVLHIGHAKLLAHAKTLGDKLVLGINTDSSIKRLKGAGRPIVPQTERAEILSAIEAVDYIVFFDEDTPLHLIEQLRPDVIVKGGNFKPEEVIGYELLKGYGGKVEVVQLAESRNQLGMASGIED